MCELSKEDKDLFAKATKDVTKIANKPVLSKKTSNIKTKKMKNKCLITDVFSYGNYDFTNNDCSPVSAHQSMFFQQSGVRKQDIKKLKKGLFTIEITEDLHVKTESIAEKSIHLFLQEAMQHNYKHGLLIHGKGYNSNSEKPALKNLVKQMLTGHPNILALCSAKPKDGGTGAVYILFKNKRH
jgi:DNA-nicking Smr family endonuclease